MVRVVPGLDIRALYASSGVSLQPKRKGATHLSMRGSGRREERGVLIQGHAAQGHVPSMTDDPQVLQSIQEGEKNVSPPLQTAPIHDQGPESRMPSMRQSEARAVRCRGDTERGALPLPWHVR